SQVYQLLPSPELADLLEEMIASYAAIDIRHLSFQTHATLSALRGVLRYYGLVGRAQDLALVRRVYALYRTEAMTENYANYNWFGRPTWTEPCAIVDSFIVAHQLWQYTGETSYLEDAQRILYNGMAYGQRSNGGYGCDICAGANTPDLAPKVDTFEAPWCCTMRGGEGLARAIEYSHLLEQDRLYLPYFGSSLAAMPFTDGDLWLVQRSDSPHSGVVQIEIVKDGPPTPKTLCLYIPSWVQPDLTHLFLNGTRLEVGVTGAFMPITRLWQVGDRITLELTCGVRREPTINQHTLAGQHAYWCGPLLLGISRQDQQPLVLAPDVTFQPLGAGRFQVSGTEYILAPTDDLNKLTMSDALRDRRQVLFADGGSGG
ncbi:MAG: glycoside hydrolase family 127 protein, partial [Anaerolineae bacterium]